MEHEGLMRIWTAARQGEALETIAYSRFCFLLINFTTTQRANFLADRTVGATSLGRQAVLAVAMTVSKSAMPMAD